MSAEFFSKLPNIERPLNSIKNEVIEALDKIYLDNKINSEYLDFSITRSSMLMSRDVIYTNSNNILKADNIEIDIETKNTKIYMFQNDFGFRLPVNIFEGILTISQVVGGKSG